jgi:release factor glutamine methyltransferase
MDVNRELLGELVAQGLDAREARWLVQEFSAPDGTVDVANVRRGAQRRRQGEPLQYVLGHWPFRSLDLEVDPRVLIPRPETEELVGVAMQEIARGDVVAPLIVDLGCGSGAIGLALLQELAIRGRTATLVAVDESNDALDVARANAFKHELSDVTFVRSSWYDELDPSLRGHVDVIVANPPYVGSDELDNLDALLRHEPRGALVANDARGVVGFEDVAIVVGGAPEWLTPRGVLICEHAELHREAVLDAAANVGFLSYHDVDDMAGLPRILVARRS